MGWEYRGAAGPYYTRSLRRDGRVVREYLGCSDGARILAALDDADREERAEARARQLEERGEALAVEAALAELNGATELLMREALKGAGYHRHRGQWRRKRKA